MGLSNGDFVSIPFAPGEPFVPRKNPGTPMPKDIPFNPFNPTAGGVGAPNMSYKPAEQWDPAGELRKRLGVSESYKLNPQLERAFLAQKFMGEVDPYTRATITKGIKDSQALDPRNLLAMNVAKAKRQSGIEDVLAAQMSSANSQRNPLAARRAQFAAALAQQKSSADSQALGAQMAAQEQAQRAQTQQSFMNQLLDLERQRRQGISDVLGLGFQQQQGSRSALEKYGVPALGAAATLGAAGISNGLFG